MPSREPYVSTWAIESDVQVLGREARTKGIAQNGKANTRRGIAVASHRPAKPNSELPTFGPKPRRDWMKSKLMNRDMSDELGGMDQ
jgi:hypothetical protein